MKREVFVIMMALTVAKSTLGQTMYRCTEGGKTTYQGSPCAAGAEKRIAADGGPTREDIERARMRARAAQQADDEQLRANAAESARQSELRDRAYAGASLEQDQTERMKRDSEKVLVHGRDGWDRKPRGQLDAERSARAAGRAAALAGEAAPPAMSSARSTDSAAWQNEKALTHGRDGWGQDTRGSQVQKQANGAYVATKHPVLVSCHEGGCVAADGQFYSGGPVAYFSPDGRTCTRGGMSLSCR